MKNHSYSNHQAITLTLSEQFHLEIIAITCLEMAKTLEVLPHSNTRSQLLEIFELTAIKLGASLNLAYSDVYEYINDRQITIFHTEDNEMVLYAVDMECLMNAGIITEDQFNDEDFCKYFIPSGDMIEETIAEGFAKELERNPVSEYY